MLTKKQQQFLSAICLFIHLASPGSMDISIKESIHTRSYLSSNSPTWICCFSLPSKSKQSQKWIKNWKQNKMWKLNFIAGTDWTDSLSSATAHDQSLTKKLFLFFFTLVIRFNISRTSNFVFRSTLVVEKKKQYAKREKHLFLLSRLSSIECFNSLILKFRLSFLSSHQTKKIN